MKTFTDIEQSKKLAKILPLESADMVLWNKEYKSVYAGPDAQKLMEGLKCRELNYLPCWSFAALLQYLKELKPLVYLPVLFVNDNKWTLQYVERGHGNAAEITSDNPVDACYEMIIRLHEQNIL